VLLGFKGSLVFMSLGFIYLVVCIRSKKKVE
jgi:hypothetical protein